MAQCFDAGDAEGGIEGSIEEAGVLQQGEGLIEELGATVICTTSAPMASQARAFSMISGWPTSRES